MAITVTDRGCSSSNVAGTAYSFSPTTAFTAGGMAVLVITADNSGNNVNNIDSVTDSLGNTWSKRNAPLYDPGAASAGIQGAIFDTPMAQGTLGTATTITVNFGATTTAKGYSLIDLTPESQYFMAYVTAGVGTGAGTASPTVTTGTIDVGHVVIGAYHSENVNATTGDSDTTNGSWSSQQTTTVGAATSGIRHSTQYKIQTTTSSTQTFNPTTGSAQDCILSYAVYRQYTNTNGSAGAASATGTANNDLPKVGATGQAAAAATGAAAAAAPKVGQSAGVATATGAGANAIHGIGSVADASSSTGSALDATAQTGAGQITFDADAATATAAALAITTKIAASSGYARARSTI